MSALEVITPVPHAMWERVFASDPDATPFHSPHWMRGIVNTGRFTDESRLYVTPTSNIILPLVGYRLVPWFDVAASVPRGYGLGGVIADHGVSGSVVAEILADLARSRFRRIAINPNPLSAGQRAVASPGWRTGARTSHVLSLTGGVDQVFARMQPRKRSAIRKAFRAGFELERGNTRRLIDAFYALLLRWWENKGRGLAAPAILARWLARRVEPHGKFVAMADAMGDALRVYVASVRGRPVAASILVLSSRSAAYWRGASDLAMPDAAGANDVLQGRMIEDACAAGCGAYFMGQSGGQQSLIDYKERLGARSHHYVEYIATITRQVRHS